MQKETVGEVLREMLRHPMRNLVYGWNWKSAVLSAIYRALIFFFSAFRGGWRSALTALTLEALFRIVTTGLYGAFAQRLRNAEPVWLSATWIMLIAPGILQIVEYAIHAAAGTPGRVMASIISTAASGVSCLFGWYAMRRGAFLTGAEGQGLLADLKQYPAILAEFLLAGPRYLLRRLQ